MEVIKTINLYNKPLVRIVKTHPQVYRIDLRNKIGGDLKWTALEWWTTQCTTYKEVEASAEQLFIQESKKILKKIQRKAERRTKPKTTEQPHQNPTRPALNPILPTINE